MLMPAHVIAITVGRGKSLALGKTSVCWMDQTCGLQCIHSLCFALADISRDSMWMRVNCPPLRRKVMVCKISAPPLNLRAPVSPNAQHPLSPLGFICDERQVCGVIPTRCWHRQSSLSGLSNDQWTLTLQWHTVNGCFKQKRWQVMKCCQVND